MFRKLRQTAFFAAGIAVVLVVAALIVRPAHAQGLQQPKGDGEAHFTTNIGSFKLLGLTNDPVTGHFSMTATGTVLVTGVKSAPVTTGNLKLEYSYAPLQKYAFHGTGTLTLDGPFRSVQWFGTGLKADFKGRAKLRLVGEFDKDLNTGFFWTTDPNKKDFWSANSIYERVIPDYTAGGVNTEAVPVPHQVPAGK